MNEETQALLDRIAQSMDTDQIQEMPEDRRRFFEGLYHLSQQDLDEAHEHFKQAQRQCQAPFDALAGLALAEVERLQGKPARAIKRLKALSQDETQDDSIQRAALMSQLALYEARGNARMTQKIQGALDALDGSS